MAGVELGEGLLQLLLLLPRWCVQETISPTFFVFTFEGTLVLVLEVVAVVVEAVERVGGQGGQKVEASRPDDALGDVIAVERQVEDVLETVIWYLEQKSEDIETDEKKVIASLSRRKKNKFVRKKRDFETCHEKRSKRVFC